MSKTAEILKVPLKFLASAILLSFFTSCSSYENFKAITQDLEIPSQNFQSDYNQTWQAILQVMRKYDIEKQNQESGMIKTRWIDNTRELNFADSFGADDSVKSAKFRVTINLVKSSSYGREITKVSVYKRQLVEQDFLQGWKETRTDGIQEKILLYRIERSIALDNAVKEIDKKREREQLNTINQ